jgi:hypothetical protein
VAYVCVNDSSLLDKIQEKFNCLASGDGQLVFNTDALLSEVEEIDDCELKATMQEIIAKVEGKAGEIYIYAK